MTLAGGTFPSALPPPCTRGQTRRCQTSSAMVDRNTWHGRHQKTVLTLCPAPEYGAQEMQISSISFSPRKPTRTISSTPIHARSPQTTCPWARRSSSGWQDSPGGCQSMHGQLRRGKLEEMHAGARGTRRQRLLLRADASMKRYLPKSCALRCHLL